MPEIWKILFDRAIKQLDQAGIKKQHWSLGGGTVLRMYYNHRESKDIDIFFHDQQLLAYISPRTNDANEDYLLTYAEGSVFTKIIFPEGEVDFIFGSQISDTRPSCKKISNNLFYVDSPIEIICKKMYYRAYEFSTRDIFDLAITYEKNPVKLVENAYAVSEQLPIIAKMISELNDSGLLEKGLKRITLLPGGEKIRGKEYTLCCECLERMEKSVQLDRKYGKEHSMENDISR